MKKLTLGYCLLLAGAHAIGFSFVSSAANGLLVVVAILAGALLTSTTMAGLIQRRISTRWLRRACQGGAGLAVLLATVVALLATALGGALAQPDVVHHPDGYICRGWTLGGATVSAEAERIDVALFRPLGPWLQWKLAARSWHGSAGEPFEGFWTECGKLAASRNS